MILLIHIIIALSTIASAVGSVVSVNKRLVKATPYLLGGTILSGIGLGFMVPGVSMLHLCASGLALSAVTVVLHKVAVQRLATV